MSFVKSVPKNQNVLCQGLTPSPLRLELFGFPGLKEDEEAKITALLQAFDEVAVNSAVIDRAIEIRRRTKMKVPDAIIGASALVLDCNLITRNVSDFTMINGLKAARPS